MMKSLLLWLLSFVLLTKGKDLGTTCQHPSCEDGNTCKSKKFEEACYYTYTDKKRTWTECRALCKAQGLTMVKEMSSLGSALHNWIESFSSDSSLWLGARWKEIDKWTFVNKVSLRDTYLNVPAGFQESDLPNRCGAMMYHKTSLNDIKFQITEARCDTEYTFICRFGKWNNANSFYISESSTNWYNARSRCKELGGDLLYLHKGESFELLRRKLPITRNETHFIGLTKGMWEWEDNIGLWIHDWPTPKTNDTKNKCLALNQEGIETVVDCNTKLYALCKTVDKEQMTRCKNATDIRPGNGIDEVFNEAEECSRSYEADASLFSTLAVSLLINITTVIIFIFCRITKKKTSSIPLYSDVVPRGERPRPSFSTQEPMTLWAETLDQILVRERALSREVLNVDYDDTYAVAR